MYLQHFSLARFPFVNVPDEDMFFTGGERGRLLDYMLLAVTKGEGVIKLTGGTGYGKTMIGRMLVARLPPSVVSIYLANSVLSIRDLFLAMGQALNLSLDERADTPIYREALEKHLNRYHLRSQQVALFIDEAQNMPPETLIEVFQIASKRVDNTPLIQLVLLGQPSLDALLRFAQGGVLAESVDVDVALRRFKFDEQERYLLWRLERAGASQDGQIFHARAKRQIHRLARGVVRHINLVAHKSLQEAYLDGQNVVSVKHVRQAAQLCDFLDDALKKRRWLAAMGVGTLLLGGGSFLFWDYFADKEKRFEPVVPTDQSVLYGGEGLSSQSQHKGQQSLVQDSGDKKKTVDSIEHAGPAKDPLNRFDHASQAKEISQEKHIAGEVSGEQEREESVQNASSLRTKVVAEDALRQKMNGESEEDRSLSVVRENQKEPVSRLAPSSVKEVSFKEQWTASQGVSAHLQASARWLKQKKKEGYVIQLVQVKKEEVFLENMDRLLHLFRLRELDQRDLRIFHFFNNYFAVYYGFFPTFSEGIEALSVLPAEIREFGPNLQAVRLLQETVDRVGIVVDEESDGEEKQ
ncbi:AAA family ATPase [Magnetococcales bacterium HHB-1]